MDTDVKERSEITLEIRRQIRKSIVFRSPLSGRWLGGTLSTAGSYPTSEVRGTKAGAPCPRAAAKSLLPSEAKGSGPGSLGWAGTRSSPEEYCWQQEARAPGGRSNPSTSRSGGYLGAGGGSRLRVERSSGEGDTPSKVRSKRLGST